MNEIFRALAHPTRREILMLLRHQQRSAGELAKSLGIRSPTLSAHLAKLKQAELISDERQGTSLIYQLNSTVLENTLLRFLENFNVSA